MAVGELIDTTATGFRRNKTIAFTTIHTFFALKSLSEGSMVDGDVKHCSAILESLPQETILDNVMTFIYETTGIDHYPSMFSYLDAQLLATI